MERFKNFINLSKKYVALGLAVTLTLGVLLPVTAVNAQENEYQSDLEIVAERFEEISEVTTEIDLEELPALEQRLLNDLETNQISVQTELSNLDLEEKTVLEHEDGYFIIAIPIVNENYNMLSNLTVTYNEDFDVIIYAETHFQESENGFFKVINYVNGVLVSETETEFAFIENDEFEAELQALEDALTNPRIRNLCIQRVLAIGALVASLVLIGCAGICIVSLGTLCGGCIVAAVPNLTKIGISTQKLVVACMS